MRSPEWFREDQEYRRNNYDLCTAVDITKLVIVLQHMVEAGRLTKQEQQAFEAQGKAFRDSLRAANDRAFGK